MFILTIEGNQDTRLVIECEDFAKYVLKFITEQLFPLMEGERAVTYQTGVSNDRAREIVFERSDKETARVDALMKLYGDSTGNAVADIKDRF